MELILDTVKGHGVKMSFGSGRIVRTGIIKAEPAELPAGSTPTPAMLLIASKHPQLPNYGDPYPEVGYEGYYLKDIVINAVTARIYTVQLVYEFRGIVTIKDSSTLSMVNSQLHPDGFTPIYVQWINPNDPNAKTIKKVANVRSPLPMRHVTFKATVDFQASNDFLSAFGSVNHDTYRGLPKGYWLYTGIEGESLDDGITYTFTATISTKQREDWSEVNFLVDDRGQPIPLPEADVEALRSKPYEYSIDNSTNGVVKVGMAPLADFTSLFGD